MTDILRTIFQPHVSMEEDATGVLFREKEHVIYGRVLDLTQLQNAPSMENQEQWEIKIPKTEFNATKGSFRVRLTKIEGKADEYTFCCKTDPIDQESNSDKNEVVIPTTDAMFLQFQMISEKGMLKHRYNFPVEGSDLVYEVDMFLKPDGTYHEWCKIDLQVTDFEEALPPLPIDLADVITAPYGKRTPVEEAKVTELYGRDFITLNKYITPAETSKPEPTDPGSTPPELSEDGSVAPGTPPDSDGTGTDDNPATPPPAEEPPPKTDETPPVKTEDEPPAAEEPPATV